MNQYLSRLNPAERRFVIGVAVLFFVVINFFWIWPHFSDLGKLRQRMEKARTTLEKRRDAIGQKPKVEADIAKLASEGSYVPPEDQSLQFLRTIQSQAGQSGVGFVGNSRQMTSTNQFFIEQSQTITVISGEKQLVDFLYSLGSGNSLIRVREISIHPDPTRMQLNANITLVASYQKASKPAASARVPAAAPAAKSAVKTGSPVSRPNPPAPPAKPLPPKAAPTDKK